MSARPGTLPAMTSRDTVEVVTLRTDGLTKVAQIIGIVRDLVLVALVVAALVIGGRFIAAVGDRTEPAAACASPTVDEWGSYCPEGTPGG